MRSLSHLREDARWCVFREVASNTIPGEKTIIVLECECRMAIRMIESEARPADQVDAMPALATTAGAAAASTADPPAISVVGAD